MSRSELSVMVGGILIYHTGQAFLFRQDESLSVALII